MMICYMVLLGGVSTCWSVTWYYWVGYPHADLQHGTTGWGIHMMICYIVLLGGVSTCWSAAWYYWVGYSHADLQHGTTGWGIHMLFFSTSAAWYYWVGYSHTDLLHGTSVSCYFQTLSPLQTYIYGMLHIKTWTIL